MIKPTRRKLGEPLNPESIERLKRLDRMPEVEIRTDLIPEVPFDLELARKARAQRWGREASALHKKAS